MTLASRTAIKGGDLAQGCDPIPQDAAMDEHEWAELGPFLDGLAHANTPLKVAAQGVARRYDLGPRGPWILSRIASGVRLPSDLAITFRISRSLMTIELNRVIKAGLVEATPSAVDGRRTELTLTPRGMAACQSVRAETLRLLRRNLVGYSVEQVRFMAQALQDVRQLEPGDDQLPLKSS